MPGRNAGRDVLVDGGRLLYNIVYNAGRLVANVCLCIRTFKWSLSFSVRQKDLVKDVMVCGDMLMSEYKNRHPDDTDDPQDVGLSSDDEATGLREEIGIARRVAHPVRSVSPTYSQGRAVPAEDWSPSSSTLGLSGEPPVGFVRLGPDEVVIKKAVLQGIKRGAKLALEDHVPASFSMGASAGDVLLPFLS